LHLLMMTAFYSIYFAFVLFKIISKSTSKIENQKN
jgi:hypothetical protein